MKSILELIKGKPSNALQAMMDGLKTLPEKGRCEVDMTTYGETGDGKICYGCAATYTLHKLADKTFDFDTLKIYETGNSEEYSRYLDFEENEMIIFESAIDSARKGDLAPLFSFCRADADSTPYSKQFEMTTENYISELSSVEYIIKELKKNGL